MNTTDWRDALGKAFNMPVPAATSDGPDEGQEAATRGDALQQQGSQRLHIVLDGKQATIVTGFVADDEAVKEVASQLKRTLGVGGSARGGEILIQGDCRERVSQELKKLGFKL